MLVITILGVMMVVISAVAVILGNGILNKYVNKEKSKPQPNMNSKKRHRRNLPIYISISYGILIIVGGIVVLDSENHNHSSQTKKSLKGAQTTSTTTNSAAQAQKSTEQELLKLSNEIVSWAVSNDQAEKLTISAFKKYYASTSPSSKDGSYYEDWSQIHSNLLLADQYATNQDPALLRSTWQGIAQELGAVQGKSEAPAVTNFN